MATNTPEGKVKARIKKLLDSYGSDMYYFMPRGSLLGRSGVPDIIGCFHGRFFGIEVKAGHNKPTALQERELRMIQEAGGTSLVIHGLDNVDTLRTVFDELMPPIGGDTRCSN